jgi:hypothetical protein
MVHADRSDTGKLKNFGAVRQEKDHDMLLVDESETHERPIISGEVILRLPITWTA